MTQISSVLTRGIDFVLSILDTEFYGIKISFIALGLFVLSVIVRFFVVPFFAGNFKGAGSDFVKLSHRGNKHE